MFLIHLAEEIKRHMLPKEDTWAGATLSWIRDLTNPGKGKVGANLIAGCFSQRSVRHVNRPEYDLLIDLHRVEVKLSCLNDTGLFKWMQIRLQDNFTHLALVAVYPEDIKAYLIPREDLINLRPQHRGHRGDGTITYLSAKPDEAWLRPYRITAPNRHAVLDRIRTATLAPI
jgi:hypothetical protein